MKISVKTSIILFFLFNSYIVFSQTSSKISIIQNENINKLLQEHKSFNKNQSGIIGYRINVFFDSGNNSKSKAYSIKSQLMAEYPDVEAYIVYQEPNYKVKVGDFRTRLDAERFQDLISKEYKNGFIIKEMINLPKIK
ncbi:MAG: hypothetical protein AUJ97_03765 [Bacteroidetes bacterium CG2_30_32_10]|nr:MAG: hypothetical protein AUJ97_03765 [Bacteroidetes bacterium CG2_30_32_10]